MKITRKQMIELEVKLELIQKMAGELKYQIHNHLLFAQESRTKGDK